MGGGFLFGYIRAHRPELRVKENEYYRAIYCGLCREMGRCTGQCSRATLSYDLTFFALVRTALSGTAPSLARKVCIAHPLKRRTFVKSNAELEFSACVSWWAFSLPFPLAFPPAFVCYGRSPR